MFILAAVFLVALPFLVLRQLPDWGTVAPLCLSVLPAASSLTQLVPVAMGYQETVNVTPFLQFNMALASLMIFATVVIIYGTTWLEMKKRDLVSKEEEQA